MNSLFSQISRDVGLAGERYSSPESLSHRQSVASYIRMIASMNESMYRLPGYEEIDRKRGMLRRQAVRYEACGLEYAIIGCKECKQSFLGPKRCEIRICENCARKYSHKIRHRQMQIVKAVQTTKRKWFSFLTLTKKTHKLYRPTTSDVRELFRCARKRINHFWPKKYGCGAFAVMELGSNWNLHIHILLYGHFVKQSVLSDYWNDLTGDSPVVDIRTVKSPCDGVNYLLKYITKPKQFNDPEETAYYLDLLLGVRRIRAYGIFYGQGLLPNTACPCPLCAGKLQLLTFDQGPKVPKTALFFEEVFKVETSNEKIN